MLVGHAGALRRSLPDRAWTSVPGQASDGSLVAARASSIAVGGGGGGGGGGRERRS